MARPALNTKGKFLYIIGNATFSACQNLTNEIETYTNAIILGQATSENKNFYGDAKNVEFPNSGIIAYLSFAWWQDKPQWENADATVPHFPKEMTFEEYRTNQDPVLEMAMDYDFDSLVINPLDHFTQLFMAGDMERLKTESARIVKDPMYAHVPFEEEFAHSSFAITRIGFAQNIAFERQDAVIVTGTAPQHCAGGHDGAFRSFDHRQMARPARFTRDPVIRWVHEFHKFRRFAVQQRKGVLRIGR